MVSQPGQTVLTDHPELYMNLKNVFLWQMPWRHVLFLCPRCGQALYQRRGQTPPCQRWGQALCQRRGQAPLPAAGSGTLPETGSGLFVRDGVRSPCQRWGQAPLPAAGSGTLLERRGQAPLARDGVRHLFLRWGLTPEGIVTYLHLRFILRCFIIVGAGDSTNIA